MCLYVGRLQADFSPRQPGPPSTEAEPYMPVPSRPPSGWPILPSPQRHQTGSPSRRAAQGPRGIDAYDTVIAERVGGHSMEDGGEGKLTRLRGCVIRQPRRSGLSTVGLTSPAPVCVHSSK